MIDWRVPRSIAVFGRFGIRNLGNEATLAAFVEQVRLRQPDVKIVGLTGDLSDTEERQGIPVFPAHRFYRRTAGPEDPGNDANRLTPSAERGSREWIKGWLRRIPGALRLLKAVRDAWQEVAFAARSFRFLRGIDLLVVNGGGPLSDDRGGAWNLPYDVLRWCLLARAAGTDVAFFGVGAGPINSPLSRLFVRWSLSVARHRSFRDPQSKDVVELTGARGPHAVVPDLVFGLNLDRLARLSPGPLPSRTVGINVFPHYDGRYWPVEDRLKYDGYLQMMARFTAWLVRDKGYRVVLFPTQLGADSRVLTDLRAVLRTSGATDVEERLLEPPLLTLEDLVRQVDTMDLVVATRFHGMLVPLARGKPVLGLSNQPKMSHLMVNMGLGEYSLSLSDLNLASLQERFNALERDRAAVTSAIREQARAYRSVLARYFDDLFGPPSPVRDQAEELERGTPARTRPGSGPVEVTAS